MAYSNVMSKSSGDKASPCVKTILNRKRIRQMFTYIDFTIKAPLTEMSTRNLKKRNLGVKCGGRVALTTLPPSVSRLSK
jgi:hypothetical protein